MSDSLPLAEGLHEFATVFMPARNLATRTREEYANDLQDLIHFLEQQDITTWQEVDLPLLQLYQADLDRRQLKASSRNRKTYTIRTFFKYLVAYDHRDEGDNPAQQLVPPKVPKQERRFLQESEYQALLAQIRSPRDRAIVEVLLQTGLRLSELAALTTGDIELPKRITKAPENVGVVTVKRKGSKVAQIPLNWKVCKALKAWLKVRKAQVAEKELTTDGLWLSRVGTPLQARAIRKMVKKYMARAGIEDASVNALRHTMATHYLAKGGDLRGIQDMLDHESIETTQVYVAMAKKVQRKMVQDLAL